MTYKRHPGIWFFIWSIDTTFLLALSLSAIRAHEFVARSILLVWAAMIFYGLVYYHGKWIENQFRKEKINGRSHHEKNNS